MLTTEACDILGLSAWLASPRMADLLALVDPTVKEPVACVLTAILASIGDLAGHILHLFLTVASD